MASVFFQIGVIGGGAWGTALATHCARMGHKTVLWARESEVVSSINEFHQNSWFLPGISLPETLKASGELEEVVDHGEMLLMVIPSQFVAQTLGRVRQLRATMQQLNVTFENQISL